MDGFAVAEHMRNYYSMEFKILTTTKCAFSDLGCDNDAKSKFYKINYSPTIK